MLIWIYLAAILTAEASVTVIVDADAVEPVQFAALELAQYASAAAGISVEIERRPAWSERNILVLCAPPFALTAPKFPVSDHAEAYRIYTPSKGVRTFTANTPRALLYAVYDFLENELGYRWYFPYPEDNITPDVSPAALSALLAQSVDRETEPSYSFRSREFRDISPMTSSTDKRIIQQIDWWAKLRMNRFLLNFNYAANEELWQRWRKNIVPEITRRGMLVGLGEHGAYPLFLPPRRYAEDHPDWYCEIDGKRIGAMHTESGAWAQFCTTNTNAVATYLENFVAFVRDHPEIDFYYPAPNDIGHWCECVSCAKLSIADRYLRLNNQTAEAIDKVKPGTRIMHLAYSNHRLPPQETLPHPLIDVDVACWGRNFTWPLCDQRTMPDDTEYLDVFRQWDAISQQQPGTTSTRLLYHWKIMRHYWLGLSLLPLSVIDADFQCIATLNMAGFDLPLGYLGIWTKALNAYVVAHKTWNPETPADILTERFMSDYYGKHDKAGQRVYELVSEAFRDRRYGRSLTLAWFPDTSKVRDIPLDGLGDNARHAVACLDEALAITALHIEATTPEAKRFQKLHTVVRHARDEQRVLVQLDALMRACNVLRQQESEPTRQDAMQAWEATAAANDALADNYSLEEDEAGLYWGGASYKQLGDALAQWRRIIEPLDWHHIGHWQTDDFNNNIAPVVKRFDATDALADHLPAITRIRFQYTGGELGASTRRVALIKTDRDGKETLLAEDRHGGFAGYIHENAVYMLDVMQPQAPEAQYFIEVELAAYAVSGSVATRGCNGDIFLGLPQ